MLEPGSDVVGDLWNAADTVASTLLLYPEARAAMARAVRARRLEAGELRQAVRKLDLLYERLLLIGLDAVLVRHAGELAERHALAGYDAVHLASALSLDDRSTVIATWDRDLRVAASAAGRTVVPAP